MASYSIENSVTILSILLKLIMKGRSCTTEPACHLEGNEFEKTLSVIAGLAHVDVLPKFPLAGCGVALLYIDSEATPTNCV